MRNLHESLYGWWQIGKGYETYLYQEIFEWSHAKSFFHVEWEAILNWCISRVAVEQYKLSRLDGVHPGDSKKFLYEIAKVVS